MDLLSSFSASLEHSISPNGLPEKRSKPQIIFWTMSFRPRVGFWVGLKR